MPLQKIIYRGRCPNQQQLQKQEDQQQQCRSTEQSLRVRGNL